MEYVGSGDTFQEDVIAFIYKNDKDEKYVVFGSGWVKDHEEGVPEEALKLAKEKFAPYFGFTLTDETREFKATDHWQADFILPSSDPFEKLVNVRYEAMKVD